MAREWTGEEIEFLEQCVFLRFPYIYIQRGLNRSEYSVAEKVRVLGLCDFRDEVHKDILEECAEKYYGGAQGANKHTDEFLIKCLARGATRKEIGKYLGVSEEMIKYRKRKIAANDALHRIRCRFVDLYSPHKS